MTHYITGALKQTVPTLGSALILAKLPRFFFEIAPVFKKVPNLKLTKYVQSPPVWYMFQEWKQHKFRDIVGDTDKLL